MKLSKFLSCLSDSGILISQDDTVTKFHKNGIIVLTYLCKLHEITPQERVKILERYREN